MFTYATILSGSLISHILNNVSVSLLVQISLGISERDSISYVPGSAIPYT